MATSRDQTDQTALQKPSYKAQYQEAGEEADKQKDRKTTSEEWINLDFKDSPRAVGDREGWRALVQRTSGVPQRPLKLRDRLGEDA